MFHITRDLSYRNLWKMGFEEIIRNTFNTKIILKRFEFWAYKPCMEWAAGPRCVVHSFLKCNEFHRDVLQY